MNKLYSALEELVYEATHLAPREDLEGYSEEVRRPIIKQSVIDRARAVLREAKDAEAKTKAHIRTLTHNPY